MPQLLEKSIQSFRAQLKVCWEGPLGGLPGQGHLISSILELDLLCTQPNPFKGVSMLIDFDSRTVHVFSAGLLYGKYHYCNSPSRSSLVAMLYGDPESPMNFQT